MTLVRVVRRGLVLLILVVVGLFPPVFILYNLPYFLRQQSAREDNKWVRYNDSDTVIVFLHGVLSDTKGCWTSRNKKEGDRFFPALVARDTSSFGEPSIFTAGYRTSVKAGKYGVADAAADVWNTISSPSERSRPPLIAKRNIIFICHSTGGIVARYLLLRHQAELKDKNIGLVLIASPSAGSEIATFFSPLSILFDAQLTKELRANSPLLEDLNDQFRDFVYQRSIRLAGIEMFETRGLVLRIKAVTKGSASQYFGMPARLAEQDHVSSVKPRDATHPAYERLVRFYTKDFLPMVETTAHYAPPFEAAEREWRTDSGRIVIAAISPDGRDVAYADHDGACQQLKLSSLTHGSSETNLDTDVVKCGPYRGITFDPSGDQIYYIRSRHDAPRVHDLWCTTRDGKDNRRILTDVDTPISFNPANPAQFAFCHGNPPLARTEILVGALSGRSATEDPRPRGIRLEPSYLHSVVWSPSGDSFLAVGGRHDADEMDLVIIGRDGNERPVADDQQWRTIDSAIWLESGEILFAATSAKGGPRRIWLTRPSGGKTTAVTRDLASYRSITASNDGKRLLALNEVTESGVYYSSPTDTRPAQEFSHASTRFDGVDGVSTTPNGDVVFTRRSGSTQDLLYYDPMLGKTRDLVGGGGVNQSPAICRSAGVAVFARSIERRTNIWKVALNGETPPQQLTQGTWDSDPACSVDASKIAYSAFDPESGKRVLWIIDGKTRRRLSPKLRSKNTLTEIDARNSTFSPDGQQLGVIYADPQNHYSWTIGVIDLKTEALTPYKNIRISTNAVTPLRWRSNDEITVVMNDKRPLFWSLNIRNGSRRTPVTVPGALVVFDFDWSVPGESLVYSGGRVESDVVTFTEPD